MEILDQDLDVRIWQLVEELRFPEIAPSLEKGGIPGRLHLAIAVPGTLRLDIQLPRGADEGGEHRHTDDVCFREAAKLVIVTDIGAQGGKPVA